MQYNGVLSSLHETCKIKYEVICVGAVEVGEKLKYLRGGLSIERVARAINITCSALSDYESGKRIPRDEVKLRIAAFYGVSAKDIFFKERLHDM